LVVGSWDGGGRGLVRGVVVPGLPPIEPVGESMAVVVAVVGAPVMLAPRSV